MLNAQIACIFLFYLVIFGVGVYAGKRRGTNRGDNTELLLAGRKLPLWIGALTMTATWVGGGYINGTAEAVYDSTRGLVWTQAPWGYALSLILGGILFARKMRSMGYTTLLDPFQQRYGKRIAAALYLPALLGEVFWSAAILVALGMTFGTVLGIDLRTAIAVSAAVAVCYTAIGGLWSVAYTDVLQLLFILFGLCVAAPFIVARSGGFDDVVRDYIAVIPGFPQGIVAWRWLDEALLLALGGIPWQVYFQRVLACPDEKSAMRLSWIAGIGCLLLAIPPVIIGAAGSVADWSAWGATAPENPAMVLPEALHALAPKWIATIGLAAVAAAVMSSIDSSILSAASMFAWNIYRPLIRPSADDRELKRWLRVGIVLIGAAATCLALSIQSVYTLWFLCADLVYVVLFPQLVMVLFSNSANRVGAIAGAFVSLLLRLGGGVPLIGLPAFIPYPMQTESTGICFPFRTFAMLAGLFVIWVVSLSTSRWDPPRQLKGPQRPN